MGQNNWISQSIFEEEEYNSAEELAVVFYIFTHRDMAGVCPINRHVTAKKCHIQAAKLDRILNRFEEIGKLEISDKRTHVWWKSGIWYSLNKGKFSPKQIKHVGKLLKKWDFCSCFDRKLTKSCAKHGEKWIERVAQLYVSKYSLVIPIPAITETETESESYSDSDSVSVPENGSKEPVAEGSGFLNKVSRKKTKQELEDEAFEKEFPEIK